MTGGRPSAAVSDDLPRLVHRVVTGEGGGGGGDDGGELTSGVHSPEGCTPVCWLEPGDSPQALALRQGCVLRLGTCAVLVNGTRHQMQSFLRI